MGGGERGGAGVGSAGLACMPLPSDVQRHSRGPTSAPPLGLGDMSRDGRITKMGR